GWSRRNAGCTAGRRKDCRCRTRIETAACAPAPRHPAHRHSMEGSMNAERFYLKQNVLAEPLINQWYAWSYLIPPATAAMYMANSHLKIMQSFLSNPQMHVTALKNPAMIGGPFINYPASR